MTAQSRGWGNPDEKGFRRRNIVPFTYAGVSFPGGVHKEVAILAGLLLKDLHRAGYRGPREGQCWGYVNRDIRGRPGVKSNHSWGLALDVDSLVNPMTSDNRVHTQLPSNTGEIARKYGFFWGGKYTGRRKDPMHFEFMGTPAQARFLTRKFSTRISGGSRGMSVRPPVSQATPNSNTKGSADVEWRTLKKGDRGEAVETLQGLIKARGRKRHAIDGVFGTKTENAVKSLQDYYGLPQTGVVDAKLMLKILRFNIK